MAFFTYPPNEAISPLFTQISVSSITTGTNVFGSETVQSAVTSFSISKPADVGTFDGRTVGIRARVTGNTNQTTGTTIALRSETRRSTMSASVSDTASFNSLSLGKAIVDFTATSIPATYTSTGTHRAILIDQVSGSNLTGNTLAISNIFGIEFSNDAVANTGRSSNIRFGSLSGGTAGNAQISDNSAFTGNWFINSTQTENSLFSNFYFGSAATALPSGVDAQTGFIRTGSGGSAPFDQAGSLIIRPRVDATAGRSSVYVFTGSPSTQALRINETQQVIMSGAMASNRADVASAATITALSSAKSFVKLTGSTITSLQGIAAGVDGQRLTLVNLTGANLTVAHENAGATAANRITTMTGADIATTANGAAEFIYDTSSSRWICLYVTA
jgi:hypothetical protein